MPVAGRVRQETTTGVRVDYGRRRQGPGQPEPEVYHPGEHTARPGEADGRAAS